MYLFDKNLLPFKTRMTQIKRIKTDYFKVKNSFFSLSDKTVSNNQWRSIKAATLSGSDFRITIYQIIKDYEYILTKQKSFFIWIFPPQFVLWIFKWEPTKICEKLRKSGDPYLERVFEALSRRGVDKWKRNIYPLSTDDTPVFDFIVICPEWVCVKFN